MFYQYKDLNRHFYSNKTLRNFLTITASVNCSNERNFMLIYRRHTSLFLKHDNRILNQRQPPRLMQSKGLQRGRSKKLQGVTAAKTQESKTLL